MTGSYGINHPATLLSDILAKTSIQSPTNRTVHSASMTPHPTSVTCRIPFISRPCRPASVVDSSCRHSPNRVGVQLELLSYRAGKLPALLVIGDYVRSHHHHQLGTVFLQRIGAEQPPDSGESAQHGNTGLA